MMNLTKYVACICEGAAEKAIMEILLDADKLIFKRDDLLEGELLRCRSGKNFEEQHLRYLDKFDKEFEGRGVKVIRYADDIVLLAKSIRAAERLLGTSTSYLEKKLKLKVNTEKSRAVSVYSIRNFGFSALRWEGTERVHISGFTQSRRRKPKKS